MSPQIEQAPAGAPPVNKFAATQVMGEAMRQLSYARKAMERAVAVSGFDHYTVWNFNPVPVLGWKLGKKYEIPSYLDRLGIKRTVHWDGGERTASVMCFRNYSGFSRPIAIGVDPGADPNRPTEERAWKLMLPIEVARYFEHEYNALAGRMGGVLVHRGDLNTVGDSSDQIIDVPITEKVEGGAIIYRTEEASLLEKLDHTLRKQKDFTFAKLAMAADWASDAQNAASLHDGPMGFTAWGNFAIAMGWQDAGELTWMVKQKTLGGCKKCGKTRSSGTAFFCSSCNHPYDSKAAFLAGYKVDLDLLATLPAEDLEVVKHEMNRRANLFKDLEPEPEPKRSRGKTQPAD